MQKIEAPTHCPCCNSLLERVTNQLFCRNPSCDAKVTKQIENFCKVLSIKGMGIKTIEKLGLNDITELFYLDRDEVISVLGAKIADKLLNEIEKSKSANLASVLSSMGIPLVGATAAKKIASIVTTIDQINQETCQRAGVGIKITENLINWVQTDYQEMKEFLPFTFEGKIQESNTNTKRVCITGKLKSYKKKSDAEGALQAAGFTLVDSVTKNTDYLVDEEGKGSSKREKAVQYGITIINDLNDLLNERNI